MEQVVDILRLENSALMLVYYYMQKSPLTRCKSFGYCSFRCIGVLVLYTVFKWVIEVFLLIESGKFGSGYLASGHLADGHLAGDIFGGSRTIGR